MNSNNQIVLRRPKAFYRPTPGQFVRPVPPSPMVLQSLAGAIEALNQKVDSLALTAHQRALATPFVPAQPVNLPLQPIRHETMSLERQRSPVPETRVERSRLLEFFD